MPNRPDRDNENPFALIDLDDIKPELKVYPHKISKKELIDEIKKYNLIDILKRIKQVSHYLFDNNLQYDSTFLFTHWRLNYFAVLVLLYASRGQDCKITKIQFEELMRKVNRYHNDFSGLEEGNPSPEDWEKFFFRLMFFDNLFNMRTAHFISRNHIIYKEMACEDHLKPEFNLLKKFFEITEVSFDHYSDTGMAISSTFKRYDVVTKKYFSGLKNKALEDGFDAFIKFNSITIEEFRKKYDDNPFALIPFLTHPLILIQEGEFICPSVLALIIRSYDIYHILFTEMKIDFSNWYGTVFEEYVGRLLKQFFEAENVFPEIKYGKTDTRTIDWFVREGKTLILFECKNKRFHIKKTITEGDLDQLKKDLDRSVAEAIYQINNTIEAIKGQTDQALKEFSDIKEFIPMVVLPEFINHNSVAVQRRVANIIKEKYNLEIDFDYHVIDIEELEKILPYRNFKKKKLLRNIIKNRILTQKYKYRSFRNYTVYAMKGKIPDNSYLTNKYNKISENSIRKFFPK